MRVLKHTQDGFEWEGENGRRVIVTGSAKSSSLTLFGQLAGKDGEVGSYKGDRVACSAIAMTWINGLTPGSNAIRWKRGAEPKWPEQVVSSGKRAPSRRPRKHAA
jgi:hypothetical protein